MRDNHQMVADLAAREAELRLKTLLELIPAGLVFINPEGNIASVNPEFERLTGAGASALAGMPLAHFLEFDWDDAIFEKLTSLAEGENIAQQARLRNIDGKPVATVLVRSSRRTYAFSEGAMVCIMELP